MNLLRKRRDLLKRYGLALALAGVALLIRGVLPMQEGTAFYELPIAAVVLSGWIGGRGPGLFALLICAAAVLYWFIPSAGSFNLPPDYALGFGLYISLGLLLSEFSGGRRRTEYALRESEERFRALVQFSFDVYWETDARHHFTRQEVSERLSDSPAPRSEIGKTRWEVPHVEPDEEAWREHRATLEAHLPFRDFELARPTADGGRRYVSVSGLPAFDQSGRFVGYRGVERHTTDRKRAEAEHRAHVWFLGSVDRINRAMQGTNDLERMMSEVLDAVLKIFACDRAWLLYPCDPDAPSWRVAMEHTRPEFPGAAARGRDLPMTADAAEVARATLDSHCALPAGPGHERQVKPEIAGHFGVRSEMLMALRPIGDQAYLFGLHQCSHPRTWTKDEQRLFEEIGHRLADALSNLIAFRRLRESEGRLEAAQHLARVGWWDRDYQTGHMLLSEESCRIFGVQAVDLPQWHGRWLSLIHPEDREKTSVASDAALAGGPRYDVEYRVVRPDGTVRMVHSQGDVIRDESGRAVRQFGVLQDITDLRYAERRLEAAQRLARVGWWERDYAAGLWLISDEAARIYGIEGMDRVMDVAEWMKIVPSIIHPEDRRRVLEANEAGLRGGPRYDIEYRIVPAEGTVRVVHVQADVTLDEAGRPVRQFGVAQDITELREAEDELRASEVRFRTFVDHASDAFFLHGGERLNLIDVNRQACESLGYSREELIGKHPSDFDARLDGASLAQLATQVAAGETVTFETLHRRKNGAVFPVEVRVRQFQQGDKHFHLSLARDITERKRVEEELRASEARFRTFVDHATDAFFLADEELNVVDVNRRACEALGRRREELIGMHPRDFDASLDAPAIARVAAQAGAGETITFETLHRHKDGTLFPVEIRVGTFRQGGKLFYLALARDITERKRAEEAMRHKDNALQMARTELARVSRLTTLGELTASIAHEVSQPLGAMIASAAAGARWLAAEPPDLAEARSALDNIAADGKRAREVIARVRALAKRQAPRVEPLDVDRKILEVLALTEHELRSHDIVLRTQLDGKLPRVAGDRVQLQQVLLNLILNAIDAMSGVHDGPRELTIVSREDGPNAVVIEVRDSGTGLDPERAEQIFEAFFTTKAEGIGIGLSISRSIIEAHGGRLWASANEPHGAIFQFSLPFAGEGR